MSDTEKGYKWWLRYVVVPLLAGSGVIALLVSMLGNSPGPAIDSPSCLLDGVWIERGNDRRLTDDDLNITMVSSHTDSAIRPQELRFRMSGPVSIDDMQQKLLVPDAGIPTVQFTYNELIYVVSTTAIENEKARVKIVRQGKSC